MLFDRFSRRDSMTLAALGVAATIIPAGTIAAPGSKAAKQPTRHRMVKVRGIDIFYREAGQPDAPACFCCTDFRHRRTCSAI